MTLWTGLMLCLWAAWLRWTHEQRRARWEERIKDRKLTGAQMERRIKLFTVLPLTSALVGLALLIDGVVQMIP